MLIVVGDRQTGRSTAAVKWLLQDELRILVTCDWKTKQHLWGLAIEFSNERPSTALMYYEDRIVTVQEVCDNALRGRSVSEVGVDDADVILAMLLGVPKVTLATVVGKAVAPIFFTHEGGTRVDSSSIPRGPANAT